MHQTSRILYDRFDARIQFKFTMTNIIVVPLFPLPEPADFVQLRCSRRNTRRIDISKARPGKHHHPALSAEPKFHLLIPSNLAHVVPQHFELNILRSIHLYHTLILLRSDVHKCNRRRGRVLARRQSWEGDWQWGTLEVISSARYWHRDPPRMIIGVG